jgi:hypothetical protein
VVWSSLVAGVGIAAAFSLAIVGATRFSDFRRDGRTLEAGMFAVLLTLGLGVSVAGVVFGIVVMTSK